MPELDLQRALITAIVAMAGVHGVLGTIIGVLWRSRERTLKALLDSQTQRFKDLDRYAQMGAESAKEMRATGAEVVKLTTELTRLIEAERDAERAAEAAADRQDRLDGRPPRRQR